MKNILTKSMAGLLLVSLLIAGTMPALAAVTTGVTRSLSANTVAPGSYVTVTLNVDVAAAAPSGVIITDVAPAGWTISNTDGSTSTAGQVKWVLCGICSKQVTDQTLTYRLNTPANAAPAAYTITGTVAEGAETANIGGTTVTVQAGAPAPAAGGKDIYWDQKANSPLPYTWTAQNFEGFYFDLDKWRFTESLTINQLDLKGTQRTIKEHKLVYRTAPVIVQYKAQSEKGALTADNDFGNGNYALEGWLGDKYVAIKGNAHKITKLLVEQKKDDQWILTVGQSKDLGEGYSLKAQMIDVDGKKAWLQLIKDGSIVKDAIISAEAGTPEADRVFKYKTTLAGESDSPQFVAYVDNVFRGTDANVVVIKFAWFVSDKTLQINTDDTFGILKITKAAKDEVVGDNDNTVTLNKASDVVISGTWKFVVADSDDLRFYPLKERKEAGTYEVRGAASDTSNAQTTVSTWTPLNFAPFYYDLETGEYTEALKITQAGLSGAARTIGEHKLVYNTKPVSIKFEVEKKKPGALLADNDFGNGIYAIEGWMGDKYVAIKGNAHKITKLLVEQKKDDQWILTVGQSKDLGEGYSLKAQMIDVDGKKAWLQLLKDGSIVKDAIISAEAGTAEADRVFKYKTTLAGESDSPQFVAYVDNVFRGTDANVVVIKYTWFVSDKTLQINTDDTFGALKVTKAAKDEVVLDNENTLTLNKASDVSVTSTIKFKVADNDLLRYYPFVTRTIAGATPTATATATATANVTATATATATSTATSTATATATATATKTATATATKTEAPGFEAVFAIAGLLAVSYIVLRQRR